MIHAIAWFGWAVGILVILSVARNPWYLALVLACMVVVRKGGEAVEREQVIEMHLLPLGAVMVGLSALFNSLNNHYGRVVLARLPESLPLIGGIITAEAMLYGALNGLALVGILGAFLLVNRVVPLRDVVRVVPRAFHEIAVVVSVALTYVPSLIRQLQHIREAQAIRGHRVRGVRDWLPLFLPLFIGGLERALQLAEAMVARGFAASRQGRSQTAARLVVVAGLGISLGGWVLRMLGRPAVGLALALLGAGLVLAALWWVGRQTPCTSYRNRTWQRGDTAVLLGVVLAVIPMIGSIPGIDRAGVFYYPYTGLVWPGFDPVIGVALLGLLVPALARRSFDQGSIGS